MVINFKILDGHMARILTFLLTYDFAFQQRADRLHSNFDALSRRSSVEADCKYCEKMENRYESENEEGRSFGMVSVHRIRQIYSSISRRSRPGLVQKKELSLFQHFRSTKTKFLSDCGKIVSAETILRENIFVACVERLHFINVNQLKYDSFSPTYQGTLVQVLIAFYGIFTLLVKLLSFSYLQSIT